MSTAKPNPPTTIDELIADGMLTHSRAEDIVANAMSEVRDNLKDFAHQHIERQIRISGADVFVMEELRQLQLSG